MCYVSYADIKVADVSMQTSDLCVAIDQLTEVSCLCCRYWCLFSKDNSGRKVFDCVA